MVATTWRGSNLQLPPQRMHQFVYLVLRHDDTLKEEVCEEGEQYYHQCLYVTQLPISIFKSKLLERIVAENGFRQVQIASYMYLAVIHYMYTSVDARHLGASLSEW